MLYPLYLGAIIAHSSRMRPSNIKIKGEKNRKRRQVNKSIKGGT